MTTEFKVTGITSEELEDLLCTATYGSGWLQIRIPSSEAYLDKDKEFDCREPHWVHRLMNGGHIVCFDYYDEDDNGDPVQKTIDLNDILNGLSKAYNECPRCMENFKNEDSDYIDCNNIMQVIIFGEIVYG